MENSNIEWTDHTFNPWMGCTKVGPGCDNCYAEARMDKRLHQVQWGPGAPRKRTSEAYWREPLAWDKQSANVVASGGRRTRVFCASLADVFDNEVPPAWRTELFELIRNTPNLDWLLLTKRISNAIKMIDEALDDMEPGGDAIGSWPWDNVWIGATIVNQAEAERDIPKLLAVPARVRFLSMEPLLGPVDLTRIPIGGGGGRFEGDEIITANVLRRAHLDAPRVHWVIVGGESGPKARPMNPNWARSLRDQCDKAGAAFFFKQWGEFAPISESNPMPLSELATKMCAIDERGQRLPADTKLGEVSAFLWRPGKRAAGRMLDGRTWDQVPA
jgi:protein gp37